MRYGIALTLTVAALAGCGGSESGGNKEAERPGLASVYAELAAETDCSALQETFERNMDRYELRDVEARTVEGSPGAVEFSYAQAANERIEELGC